MKTIVSGLTVGILLFMSFPIYAQMVDPQIDKEGEPFSWASFPTDQMALPGSLLGTEITPEGYLYTGYGELVFLVGYPPQFARQRTRRLEGGNIPVFHYQYSDGPVRYDLTTFTVPLRDEAPDRRPVNLIRVVATNTGPAERTSYFNVAFRHTGTMSNPHNNGDYRFLRPWAPITPGEYLQPGVPFDPNWVCQFEKNYAVRAGEVVYQFHSELQPVLWSTLMRLYSGPQQMRVLADSPVLRVQYALRLSAGGSRTLVFKMPVEPISLIDTDSLARLDAIEFSRAMAAVVDKWTKTLSAGIRIQLPEKKVSDTFDASLIYDMMAVDRLGDDYVQRVNKLHYKSFWLRDAAFITSAYDVTGNFDLARKCRLFFLKFQRPDGLFVSNPDQYDGWGQSLWAFGRQYRFTQDKEFAKSIYPAIQRAVSWLRSAREKDPLHLMPAGNPGDGEFTTVSAHVTGHNFWALAGLRGAITLAKAVGTDSEVKEFQREYDDYHEVLIGQLRKVANNGYMPPGIDVEGGQDWANMGALYPEVLLPPDDPMVTATLRETRAKFGEGLMTYGGWLHHYLTTKNTQASLVRGEQEQVVKDLYALLVHTSSTHAGWEFARAPWTTRDFVDDLAPHGWFAAEYIVLVRNMLLREQGNDLHLLSALSPVWCKLGDSLAVSNAPSYFGRLSMKAAFNADGMALDLDTAFTAGQPENIVIHLPWFVTVKEATVDGKQLKMTDHGLVAPAQTRRVVITWTRGPAGEPLSYDQAVREFIREYSQRYEQFLREGAPEAKPWVLR